MSIKKERLSDNTTKETLFVGVGGIGSSIVTRIAEMCKGTEADNLRFVVMDTNANDLRVVKGSNAVITAVQTSSTQSVLDYLKKDDDARNNWFPNNTTLYTKTVSEGAGQVRAISRLALNATIKNGNIQKLYKAIDELFLKDGGDLKQSLRVVIVSTAAGGTGSGIAMTVGMLIREYLHKHYREKAAIIRGYILLPGVLDTVIDTETERESLRRNGYATIKEINAFMIKASGFCGVRKDLERYKDLYIDVPTTTNGVDSLKGLPFDFCFLLDRVGRSQESMQTLGQYKEFAAQSLYEQNIGPMEGAAFGIEDNIIKEFANGDNLGRNRFGGIGASVLRYPYEEIVEYVAYSRAVACIGDGETIGEWLKYDKAFEKQKAEFKKKRSYTMEKEPTIAKVYMSQVNNGNQRFDNDIKGSMATNVEKFQGEVARNIETFLSAFYDKILADFKADPDTNRKMTDLSKLSGSLEYDEKDDNIMQKVMKDYQKLLDCQNTIKNRGASSAKASARSILYEGPSLMSQNVEAYNLEKLFRFGEKSEAMHPNAIRYMLYALQEKLAEKFLAAQEDAKSAVSNLKKFAQDAHEPKIFDVTNGSVSKAEEANMMDVIRLLGVSASLFDSLKGGKKEVWDKINKFMPQFASGLKKYSKAVLEESAYEAAGAYISELCKEFENFYGKFETKVLNLVRTKKEIADKLKFREGNSVRYVCASKKHLDRIVEMCPTTGDNLMLPSDLCAKIFDAIKANAENTRMAQYDPALAKPGTDIFDTVMIDFFKESVCTDCDEVLNINILKAITREQEFDAYFKAKEYAEEGEVVFTPEISDVAKMDYLREKIMIGNRLASPGIGYSNFNEPREVKLCAYNKVLNDLRDLDINQITQPIDLKATATNTVSKYDIHFFNALYNVTPDMLSRFKSPDECNEDEQYNEEAGIYFQAYHDYIKKIGPDSTKSAAISLHIDKRWDSLTEMPEISLDANYKDMVKIHSAMIYGVVHGMILTHPSSRYDAQKRIFALEDTEGERTTLIVSNNTECDEFYEVLDALYRDRASVAKIYEMQEERCQFDIDSNRRYTESAFVRDIESFRIGDGHAAPTSVFEIPLMYYNSLPRSKMDDNELSIMVDSVIAVLEKEIAKYEQEVDRDPFLAERLEKQFRLFIDNFNNDDYNVDDAMRKNTDLRDNRVANMVLRKVCNKIKRLNTFSADTVIEELRALVK